jgi:hypothetical protein
VNQPGTHDHDAGQGTRRQLQAVATATALAGGPLFLLGVLLHPARDGAGIAAAGQTYGTTHGLQAIGLLLVAPSLVSRYALDAASLGRAGLSAFLAAVAGTVLWFGLIVVDGTRNPVTATYAPELVHTTAHFDPGGSIIILLALLVFPVGYALLGRLLARQGARWPGLLGGSARWRTGVVRSRCLPWDRGRRSSSCLRSPARCRSRSGWSYLGGAGDRT